jgi:hypothetical protein
MENENTIFLDMSKQATTQDSPSKFLPRFRLAHKPPLRKPSLDLPRIPLHPRRLGPHTVKTLRKTLIESLGTLSAEKRFDLVDGLKGRKVVCDDLDDAAEHAEAGGEFFNEGVPVFLGKGPECVDSLGVGAQSNPRQIRQKNREENVAGRGALIPLHGKIDILLFDLVESNLQGPLNQLWILTSSQITKRRIPQIRRNRQIRPNLINSLPLPH